MSEFKANARQTTPDTQRTVPVRGPAAPVHLVAPAPAPLAPFEALQRLAFTRVERQPQRQAAAPVLQAAATLQRWAAEGGQQRLALQRQIAEVQAGLPAGAEQAALQRQADRARPPTLPLAFQRQASGQPSGRTPSISDWGQAYAFEMGRQTPDAQGMYAAGPAVQVQRQIAGGLAHSVRTSSLPPVQRYAEVGQTLARIQRQPLGAATVRGSLSAMLPGERPAIQRALDDANLALQRQEAQDAQVEQLHALQRYLAEQPGPLGPAQVGQRVNDRRGGGEPLPEAVRRHLEQGLNADLSRVRIHADAEADLMARRVGAKAFTSGQDIYFRRGQYQPNTKSGLELLAHEVTHTVQQARGQVAAGIDPDPGLEQQARESGSKLAEQAPNLTQSQGAQAQPAQAPSAKPDVSGVVPPTKLALNPAWTPAQFQPSPYAPGVYTPRAALQRAQNGAVQRATLNPLYSLFGMGMQRDADPTIQRDWWNPVDVGKAAVGATSKLINAGADAAKSKLSEFANSLPGYHEMCLAFGKDLLTGKAMQQDPNAILDALAKIAPPEMKDMLVRLRETQAIPKAWGRFKKSLAKLNLANTSNEVVAAVKNGDLNKAKAAIAGRVSGFQQLLKNSVNDLAVIALEAVAASLGPKAQRMIAQFKKDGSALVKIMQHPDKFAKNLVTAVGGGFQRFGKNAAKVHLPRGLGKWLGGQDSDLAVPGKLDFQGVFMMALSVVGLTYHNMRGLLVKELGTGGEAKVARAEQAVGVLRNMKINGLRLAGEFKDSKAQIGNEIKAGLITEVSTSVIQAAVGKLAAWLVPGGAVVGSLVAAFQSVQFVLDRLGSFQALINGVFASVGAIAAGQTSAASQRVEGTLGAAVPLALGFLAKLLGLGNIGKRLRGIVERIGGKLRKFLQPLVKRVAALINSRLGQGKPATATATNSTGKKPGRPDKPNQADHDEKVKAGLADIPNIERKFAQSGKLTTKNDARKVAASVKSRHTIFKSIKPRFEKINVIYDWVASSGSQAGTVPLATVSINVEGIRREFWNNAGRPGWNSNARNMMKNQYPQHHLTVAGVTLPNLKAGFDRRHIVAFDQTVTQLASQLNNMTIDDAAVFLSSKGFGPRARTETAVKAAFKKLLSAEFNKVENLFVDGAAQNQDKGRQMELAEQRRIRANQAGNQAQVNRETRTVAVHATDVPRGTRTGKSLGGRERAAIGRLRSFASRIGIYEPLRGHARAAKARTAPQNLIDLLDTANATADQMRQDMATLAAFSKTGSVTTNTAIRQAIEDCTEALRHLSDIIKE